MKKYLILILFTIPICLSAQRLGSFYHSKATKTNLETKEHNSETSEKPDEVKLLLEGIAPLSGSTIIPTINAQYDGIISDRKNAFSVQIFMGNDLNLEGDTLGSIQVRNSLAQGFFIPEASFFRFNFSWVYAANKLKRIEKSSSKQQLKEKGLFLGANLDLVNKRTPIAELDNNETTWDTDNFWLAYLTLTSQYRLVNGQGFQISGYFDFAFAGVAGGTSQVEAYYSTPERNASAAQISLIPKSGFEVVFNNLVFDIGYVWKTESMEQYYQSNDPGFVAIKVGMNTKLFGKADQ